VLIRKADRQHPTGNDPCSLVAHHRASSTGVRTARIRIMTGF
jgi:hypothetical protein